MEQFIKITKTSLILFCSAFLLACNSSTSNTNEKYLLLPPAEFDQRLALEKSPQIIDVRSSDEFLQGSIIHAKNYSVMDGTLYENLANLDSTETIFVFCQKGGRSAKAVELLKQSGFKSIIELKGGMDAWYDADPVN